MIRPFLSLMFSLAVLCPAIAQEPARTPQAPVPVRFSLERPGCVTLVIEDETGRRVRNLIGGVEFAAGEHVVYWDGLDEGSKQPSGAGGAYRYVPAPVAPGDYQVRGLCRDALGLRYEFTVYPNCGSPPWPTDLQRGAGGWLADHAMPHAACFVPAARGPGGVDQVVLASTVAESSQALAWVDMTGKKIAGRWRVGGQWTGAAFLAYDWGQQARRDIYLYSLVFWKPDGKGKELENKAEIRITGFTPDREIPVAMLHPSLPEGQPWQYLQAAGLAVHNGLVVYGEGTEGRLVFLRPDPGGRGGTNTPLGDAHVPGVRDLAFDRAGHLLVLTTNSMLRYTLASSILPLTSPEHLALPGLEDPQRFTVAADGRIYVSDWGRSHQVKVFASGGGKQLATIGKAGAPASGPYDAAHMNRPLGLAVSDDGRLWVAEKFRVPKRVSVWSPGGELARAFYGPPGYGGGGFLDPHDPTRFFYASTDGGLEFRVDWKTGTAKPTRIYWLAEETPAFAKVRWKGPEAPFHFGGHFYLTNDYGGPTSGSSLLQIWKDTGTNSALLVVVGRADAWPYLEELGAWKAFPDATQPHPGKRFNFRQRLLVCWVDTNGDRQVQRDELQFRPCTQEEGIGRILNVTLQQDFSVLVSHSAGVLKLAPRSVTAEGLPRYDLRDIEPVVRGLDDRHDSGGGQTIPDLGGMVVLTGGPIEGYRDGKRVWQYHSEWPSLHAGHAAPGEPRYPGQLLATTRVLGPAVHPKGDAGAVWALNSDKGVVYLLTADGLYVGTLGAHPREGRPWNMPEAIRGMDLSDVNMLSEHFFPSIAQLDDGRVYLVAGKSHSSIVRVDGLDSIRRLSAPSLHISPEIVQRVFAYQTELAALERARKPVGELTVARWGGATSPTIDGDLSDWPTLNWATIDTTVEQHGWGRPQEVPATTGALAVDPEYLYIALRTREAKPLENSGADPQTLFRTGGAIDLRLATRPISAPRGDEPVEGDLRLLVTLAGGKPLAMLYRPRAPGADEPVVFTSPLWSVRIDKIEDVSAAIRVAVRKQVVPSEVQPQAKLATTFIELAVPLKVLGWDPEALPRTTGDLGLLVGRDGVTVERVYWHDKAAGLVSDIPSEARLTPAQWGPIEVTPARQGGM